MKTSRTSTGPLTLGTLLAAALLAGVPANAQAPAEAHAGGTSAVPAVNAVRASAPIKLDGALNDDVWTDAPVVSGFVQRQPTPGAPASERTEARVLYDDQALYVSMRMYDSHPDSIAARLGRRDEAVFSDWAYVMVDSHDDNRTGYAFVVNPRGVKRDYFLFDDLREDYGWDAVWDVATAIDAEGWTAEFRIPLSQLRFRGMAGAQNWGLNFQRRLARRDEWSFWSPTPPTAPGVVSSFGTLAGLSELQPPRHLEVQPYAVSRLTRAPEQAANPFYEENNAFGSMGMDLKYGVTSNLTLSATVNPDFGQVEADPAVVNLTAFESFFPERRPFFVEGTDIFSFNMGMGSGDFGNEQLFYSRRVGRAPQRTLATPTSPFVDVPSSTGILGAAKLSGKVGNGWSVGVLDAVTAREEGRYLVGGEAQNAVVEPMTNYAVLRASRLSRRGLSNTGFIATATNREDAEGLGFLRSSAYTGGVDTRHRFGGGNYELSGWMLGSWVQGSREAITATQLSSVHLWQRPDAGYLDFDSTRTSLGGMAANLQLTKIGGGNWVWGVIGQARSPGFEVNDLGYQRFSDMMLQSTYVGRVNYKPGKTFYRWSVVAGETMNWNFGGDRVGANVNVTGSFLLPSFYGASGGMIRLFGAMSPDALRGGPMLRTPAQTQMFVNAFSDPRKTVNVKLAATATMEDETRGRYLNLAPTLNLRASGRTDLSLTASWTRYLTESQYVPVVPVAGGPYYLFGELKQTTAALTARLAYAFSPELSLQFYAQPFISAGDYSNFKHAVDSRARTFDGRFHTFTDGELSYNEGTRVYMADTDATAGPNLAWGNPDFNFKQLRTNTVLRWEYRPGSTVFLVWSQGRTDTVLDGRFDLGPDAGDLFRSPSTNTLLLKVSYWLGM